MVKCSGFAREAARSACELPMTTPYVAETVIAQGRAIEALGTIEPTDPFERTLAWFYWIGKIAAKGYERYERTGRDL
jgi:hypothetical protein